jgi:hypothetical protein
MVHADYCGVVSLRICPLAAPLGIKRYWKRKFFQFFLSLGFHVILNTFFTSSPRWLMTLTAILPCFGFSKGRNVSLWRVPAVGVDRGGGFYPPCQFGWWDFGLADGIRRHFKHP